MEYVNELQTISPLLNPLIVYHWNGDIFFTDSRGSDVDSE